MLHLNLFMQLGPSWMALKVGCQMKYSKRFRRLTIYLFIHFNARLFLPEKNLKDLKFVFFDFWLSRFKWFKREKANCFKRFYWSHGTPFSWLSASSSSCQTSLLLIIHDFLFFSPQIKIVKTFFWFCCSEEIIFSIIFFFHYLLLFFQRQLHFSVETVCILVNGVAFALGDFLYCLLHSLRVHFIVKSRFFISRIIESKTTDRDDETGSEPKNWTS